MIRGPKPRPVAARFWEKVDKSGGFDDCWEWQAACIAKGYGHFGVGSAVDGTRKVVRAHILAWELVHGRKVPAGLMVMHSCNNPPCCNPKHLSVGTAQQNSDHMVACGRHSTQKSTG